MVFSWLLIIGIAVSLVPLLVGLASSYLKVSIVLGLLRSGLGAQQVPGAIVTFGFSLAITLFVMGPIATESMQSLEKIDWSIFQKPPSQEHWQILKPSLLPWTDFMKKHSGQRELEVLSRVRSVQKNESSKEPVTQGPVALPGAAQEDFSILALAFLTTEVKEAFLMGCVLLIPFLVVDLVISNILVGLGLSMLSPTMITLPLKLILFVWADGWLVLCNSLIRSYGV